MIEFDESKLPGCDPILVESHLRSGGHVAIGIERVFGHRTRAWDERGPDSRTLIRSPLICYAVRG